ncbi:MAG: nucleotidyltransferase family protein [Chloroflexi bacterium]|nr:nucleotidyltransferase family protein [Chloroflexota bacterium]
MVPCIVPSESMSNAAPGFWGVDPLVATTVANAARSPRAKRVAAVRYNSVRGCTGTYHVLPNADANASLPRSGQSTHTRSVCLRFKPRASRPIISLFPNGNAPSARPRTCLAFHARFPIPIRSQLLLPNGPQVILLPIWLRPLTIGRPKPMVPIVNAPVMEHILGLLKRHGITEVVVTLQYMSNTIQDYFGDGSEFGMVIHYTVEETPLGTAGSVKNAEHLLDEPFIVISGDALTDFDLEKVISFHREREAMATLTLYQVPNPLEYGVVILDEEHRVTRFLEKPSWGEVFSDTVNTGIYVLDPGIFKYVPSGKSVDWSNDVFPQLLQNSDPMFGYVASGYWCPATGATSVPCRNMSGQMQTCSRSS